MEIITGAVRWWLPVLTTVTIAYCQTLLDSVSTNPSSSLHVKYPILHLAKVNLPGVISDVYRPLAFKA